MPSQFLVFGPGSVLSPPSSPARTEVLLNEKFCWNIVLPEQKFCWIRSSTESQFSVYLRNCVKAFQLLEDFEKDLIMFISVMTNDELGSRVRSEEGERARARGRLPRCLFQSNEIKRHF
jgi:hypothetical protein